MNLRFKDFLSDFMEDRNKEYKENPALRQVDAELFTVAVRNCWRVFGEQAFRRPGLDGPQSKKSAPLADAVMTALGDGQSERLNDDTAARIRTAVDELCDRDEAFTVRLARDLPSMTWRGLPTRCKLSPSCQLDSTTFRMPDDAGICTMAMLRTNAFRGASYAV